MALVDVGEGERPVAVELKRKTASVRERGQGQDLGTYWNVKGWTKLQFSREVTRSTVV